MICSNCVFHGLFLNHSASIDVCLRSLDRDLIVDTTRATEAIANDSCPFHLPLSRVREYFIYNDSDIEKF